VIANNNRPEFFVAFFGCLRAGRIAVPIDANLAQPEHVAIVNHAAPAAIVVDEERADAFREVGPGVPKLILGRGTRTGELYVDVASATASPAVARSGSPDDPAVLLYTSGTTGTPKGVVHSQASLATKTETIRRWFSFDESFRSLCLLPTSFGHGLICNCLTTFAYGGTLVICKPFDLKLLATFWKIAKKHEITTFSSVPSVVRLLLKVAEREAVRCESLKFVTCASAPLRADEVVTFQEKFGAPLLNCYGITETASWTAFSPNRPERALDSVGIMSGCEIRAVDAAGKVLPPGEVGELQVKGPSVMLGYYKNPEATAQAFDNGWFRTGDQGTVSERGEVFLVGRIKELIIRAGLNIYPAEIDTVLATHAGVADAYCTGVEDAILGEKVVACVVAKEGAVVSEAELISLCRTRLAAYKCPERIVFVDSVPKNTRGKVSRAAVRQLFLAQTSAPNPG